MFMQMAKLTDNYSEIDFHVCGTFNGIDDALEKTEFSDAVIVDTLALKNTPDGLYKVLKSVEELGKDVYFILSGWESIPKTPELSKKKLAQIENEFPFAKIKAARNVFIKQLEGFSFHEDAMGDYTTIIFNGFAFAHQVQTEALYKKLRRLVQKFREQVCLQIQKEQTLILQMHQSLTAKQKRFQITFTHVTVSVNDTFDRLERMVKGIYIDEVLWALEGENISAKERYSGDPLGTEREVKTAVYKRIFNVMESFRSSELSGSTVGRTGLQINEIMNDLLAAVERLKSCRFIEQSLLYDLENTIRETTTLISSADDYANSIATVIDRVAEPLRAKITGSQFESFKQNEIRTFVNDIFSRTPGSINSFTDESEEEPPEGERFGDEESE